MFVNKYSGSANVPTKALSINSFAGVDYMSSPTEVELFRSPNATNMINDEIGNVERRVGYRDLFQLDIDTQYEIKLIQTVQKMM